MKNIKSISFTLLFFLQFSIYSQENFEGILKFNMQIQDKTGDLADEQSKQFVGDKQTYYLKGKKYKSELNGMLKITTYHEGRDTLFTKMNGTDVLMYSLTNVDEEKVISYEIKKTDKIVLGYKCDLLEVKTNKGFHQYYFNKNLKCAPSTYENHKMGLWDFFTEKTGGALSIISISDVEDFKSTIELIAIERKNLDDTIFVKPDLPIVKMPEN
ncbi:hypothetical protein [Polaribacter aestuariivivens]|uniref:hypothetical protein n=1 Tax=Polaribacter aestuariivivens TaxID=2304626 RepID=UPI003F491265